MTIFLDTVILLAIVFFCVLATRSIYMDHKNGVPSCGYVCGSACSGNCRAAQTGRTADGRKITKKELRMIRKRIRMREEGKL